MKYINQMLISLFAASALAGCVSTGSSKSGGNASNKNTDMLSQVNGNADNTTTKADSNVPRLFDETKTTSPEDEKQDIADATSNTNEASSTKAADSTGNNGPKTESGATTAEITESSPVDTTSNTNTSEVSSNTGIINSPTVAAVRSNYESRAASSSEDETSMSEDTSSIVIYNGTVYTNQENSIDFVNPNNEIIYANPGITIDLHSPDGRPVTKNRRSLPPPVLNETAPMSAYQQRNLVSGAYKITKQDNSTLEKSNIKGIRELDGATLYYGNDTQNSQLTIQLEQDGSLIWKDKTADKVKYIGYLQDFSLYSAYLIGQNGSSPLYHVSHGNIFQLTGEDVRTRFGGLPKEDKVVYTGYAIGSNYEQGQAITQPMKGITRLEVDFKDTTVEGLITFTESADKTAIIKLEKTKIFRSPIRDEHCKSKDCDTAVYSGKALENDKEIGAYNGHFYGQHATETVGSVSYRSKPVAGFVFGGKKTEQK